MPVMLPSIERMAWGRAQINHYSKGENKRTLATVLQSFCR
jgi:hypothetical protein